MNLEVLKVATSHGLWAVLSIFLIAYILKVQTNMINDQEQREENYISMIKELTEKLDVLNNLTNIINKTKED